MQYIENACMLKTFLEQHIVGKKDVNTLMETISNAVGTVIAKLHSKHIVHGDLTTSNILLINEADVIDSKCKSTGEKKSYKNLILKLYNVVYK